MCVCVCIRKKKRQGEKGCVWEKERKKEEGGRDRKSENSAEKVSGGEEPTEGWEEFQNPQGKQELMG